MDTVDISMEAQALKELQENVSDAVGVLKNFHDELYLLQWLKASKMNVAKTQVLVRNTIEWRREEEIDQLAHQEFCPDLKKELSVNYDGVSKTGIPVLSTSCGQMDCRGLLEKHGREKFLRMWAHIFSKAENLMIDANRRKSTNLPGIDSIKSTDSTGIIAILDMKNLPFRQIQSVNAIKVYIEIAQMFIYNFPGLVQHVYFINANRVFSMLFKMLKPFLDIDMRVYDCNETKWKAVILEEIEPDQIRKAFGGTKE